MRIDITIIDKCIINKNKQLHQFDETAYAFYNYFILAMVITVTSLLNKLSPCITKCGNKILIKLCKLISFMVDKNVSVRLFIALAHTLNKIIPVKYLL